MGIFLTTEYPPDGLAAANETHAKIKVLARLKMRLVIRFVLAATLKYISEICLKNKSSYQNLRRTMNCSCRGSPVPVLGEAALSLLLLKLTVVLIRPKSPGTDRFVTVLPSVAPGA